MRIEGDWRPQYYYSTEKPKTLPLPRTQKARGILGISMIQGARGNTTFLDVADPLDHDKSTLEAAMTKMKGIWYPPIFARPCPMTPKHGFVESRIVESTEELKEVMAETQQADPFGEVVLMPYIDADFSAVQFGDVITIGRGNAGVTSPVDDDLLTLSIPPELSPIADCVHQFSNFHLVNIELLFPPQDSIMWELVHDTKSGWHVVQARSVKQQVANASVDRYIPPSMTHVHATHDVRYLQPNELMCMVSLKKKTLFIVSSMQSHVACQLMEANEAVMTYAAYKANDFKTGDAISQPKFPPLYTTENLQDMGVRLNATLSNRNNGESKGLMASLASLIAKSALTMPLTNTNLQQLASHGMVQLLRLSAIACFGEMRHWWMAGDGLQHRGPRFRIFENSTQHVFANSGDVRSLVYSESDDYSLSRLLLNLGLAEWIFSKDWKETKGSSSKFGGAKWLKIAQTCILFYEGMRKFVMEPTQDNWIALCHGANRLSILVHNGGAGPLSKFHGSDDTRGLNQLLPAFAHVPIRRAKYLPRFRSLASLTRSRRSWPTVVEEISATLSVGVMGLGDMERARLIFSIGLLMDTEDSSYPAGMLMGYQLEPAALVRIQSTYYARTNYFTTSCKVKITSSHLTIMVDEIPLVSFTKTELKIANKKNLIALLNRTNNFKSVLDHTDFWSIMYQVGSFPLTFTKANPKCLKYHCAALLSGVLPPCSCHGCSPI